MRKHQELLERALEGVFPDDDNAEFRRTLLQYDQRMHEPTSGLLTISLLAGSCVEEPSRDMDEFARLMAGIRSKERPWVILAPGAVDKFGAGFERKRTPKEVEAGAASLNKQDCTGDVFAFIYANAAPDSLVLTAISGKEELKSRSPEYLLDHSRKKSRFIYGCPLGKAAVKSSDINTSNGVNCLEIGKAALAACGGGVGALFRAADVDAEQPERQVFADTSRANMLSWYANCGGGTTGTHVDSMHTKQGDQEVGLRSELCKVGILPMEMRVDGSTVDGLDSLNATIGFGPVIDYLQQL
jgi:hypothetical protein